MKKILLCLLAVVCASAVSAQQIHDGLSTPFQVAPTFQRGDLQKYYKWLVAKVEYPRQLQQDRVAGTVTVHIVVGADGTVQMGDVLDSPRPEFTQAVAKAIAASPKWKPGIIDGKPVAVLYTIPVVFAPRPEAAELDPTTNRYSEIPGLKGYGSR